MRKKSKHIYNDFAERYSLWAQTRGEDYYEDALHFLPRSAKWALDAGCGPGLLCFELTHHVDRVVGLDLSYSMITFAKRQQAKLKKGNLDFVVGDLSSLPFKDETFDFIATYNAIRFRSIELRIMELCRLLKPGGHMIIHENVTKPSHITGEFPIWHLFDALKNAPKYALLYNLQTMGSILSYRLNPKWIRYLWKSKKLTPELFQRIYSQLLPGCSFKRKGWRMLAFWQAPEKGAE